ncbi:MAG: TlpA family protein disulfide reductase [Anaerolineaceae bacterium]|jgi:peroxiredoxin|nr:MAG: TlpA family protein disulfide reductase [Anaerolineaceae bacterium]
MNNSRFILLMTWTLFLGMIWTVVTRVPPDQPQIQQGEAAKEGFTSPDFTLDLLGGGSVSLSDLRGKVVLINFWTSWCPPCRLEMPAIEKTFRNYKDLGLVVIGLNLTAQDSELDVAGFVQEIGMTFPVALDRDNAIGNLYRVTALPTSFFIDRNGIIRSVVVGGPMSEALIQSKVEELLQEGE